ncbi:hypothetical protein HWQ46_24215 [Shewanella sp. D64]|uniref:RHS repeat-associated core domain-containing protein n=1 Tax=unclassified Shewanella TaxID=196818 RepID=UPI0022BA6352|nr:MULTISPECIES: RHS repeat-associated core domain-containing protein [unclassified Shewanella]MEC4728631.1 hypothetical protein [Shewanella sp. D64]MEC4737880.1 hypothetical protein [Shewanella sp. E94]WBJ93867.1 hypothetical protein HWQ47_18300 [Shewanella sp. MTB7]
MKILMFTRFAINSFVALVLSVALLSFQSQASQGQTVFIPIAVGDITTFIPIMPSSSTGSVTSTTTDGSYNLNWSAVTNASYYQIIITDEDGKKRIIKVFGTSYDLAGLSLGSNTIEVQACNANHQCGVGYLAGTVSRSSKVTYQHTDMLGTPVMETDEAGQVARRSVYEPFGKRLGGEKAGIGYTGHLQDEDLGLTYMQARYYDPLIGRFYSNDPLPFRDVHSFNRYAYANNNPYKYIDPDGENPLAILGGIVGAVGGGVSAALNGGDAKQIFAGAISGGAVGGLAGATFGASLAPSLIASVAVSAASSAIGEAAGQTMANTDTSKIDTSSVESTLSSTASAVSEGFSKVNGGEVLAAGALGTLGGVVDKAAKAIKFTDKAAAATAETVNVLNSAHVDELGNN